MPVFYDPYTALQFAKQGQALGGKPVNPNMYEAMGYGVTAAMADKEAQGRGLALQEKSLSEHTRLTEEQIARQGRADTTAALTQLPITALTMDKLGLLDSVKGTGQSPAVGTGGTMLNTGTAGSLEVAAEGGAGAPMVGGSGYAVGSGTGTGYTMSAGSLGTITAGSALGSTAAGAGAGYLGAKYGPDLGSGEIGKAMATGIGMRGNKRVTAAASGSIRGAGAGAAAGTAVMPGIGTIIGTIVGGVVGMGQGAANTVICTELHRQGYISDELLEYEHIYQPNFSWATYWGYRIWADPIVRVMKKSKVLTKVVSMFGVPFIKEVAHRVDPSRKGSWFGSLLIKFGVPFCKWNYRRYQRKFGKFYARFKMVKEG